MRKTFKRTWSAGGVTLVELMVAMVVPTIAALSTLNCRYHSARQAGTAKAQIAATRTAHLLLRAGKRAGGRR